MNAPGSTRKPTSVARFVFLTLIAATCGCSPVGEQYTDVDAIGISETWEDWIILGRFGHDGPFVLADIKYCEAGRPCNFSHLGQAHTYEGFEEFELAVLRLEGPNGDLAHVVLRSGAKAAF